MAVAPPGSEQTDPKERGFPSSRAEPCGADSTTTAREHRNEGTMRTVVKPLF